MDNNYSAKRQTGASGFPEGRGGVFSDRMKASFKKPFGAGFWLFFFFLLPSALFSQYKYTKYWIQFTDKIGTPYTVSNPSQFLSPRAIQRRHNQGITVVQNDLPITPSYIDSVKKIPNVMVINRSKWFNAITIQTADTNAIKRIEKFPFVMHAQGVQRMYRKLGVEERSRPIQVSSQKIQATPNVYDYGPSLNQVDMIGGVCMHNKGFHGEGMQIAVLDAGFYKVDSLPIFDSLRTNKQILGTWDFVDNDSTVYTEHTHGAMVLSTMGGNVPGMIVGTAPKAKYWLLRTEQGATEYMIEEDNWVSGAEYADSVGADILSTSLGYTTFDSIAGDSGNLVNPDNHTYADMNGKTCRISIGTDIAVSKGMFAVCSAGNSGGSPWNFIGAPADADSVLAVGSVDANKNYSWFSSRGPSYDGRVKPNVAAQGENAVVADPVAGGIAYLSGTSFACPITAGMVACLWQAHPTLTNMQLFNAIQTTASQYGKPDTLLGYGISNFCVAHDSLSLSVHENNLVGEIGIFPNPSSGRFNLKMQLPVAAGIESLEICNMMGEKVCRVVPDHRQGTIVLDLTSCPGGIYILTLKNEKSNYSAKLVKY